MHFVIAKPQKTKRKIGATKQAFRKESSRHLSCVPRFFANNSISVRIRILLAFLEDDRPALLLFQSCKTLDWAS